MKKTIFSRILSTNFTILISALALAMLLLGALYGQLLLNQQHEILVRTANELSALVSESGVDPEALRPEINQLGNWTDIKIYVIGLDEQHKEALVKSLQKEVLSPFLQEDLQLILDENEVYRGLQFSRFFGAYTVFLGRPLYFNGSMVGVVLLFKPLNELSQGLFLIGGVFLLVMVSVLIIGFVMIRWSTMRITAPLKLLSNATQKIALRESVEDIIASEQDEIGSLTDAFNHMKNKIEAHNLEKSAFMAMVSHDIKTPLMSINGYIEALMDGVIKTAELQPTLLRVHDEINRLTRLTQELLSVSKSDEMSFIMRIERFDLVPLLKEVSDNIKCFGGKQVAVDLVSPEAVWIKADRDKIMQILMNLMSNAYKFSKETCQVQLVCQVSETYLLHLRVTDRGLGIPSDMLAFVFDPTVRLHPQIEGQGLGLSITKKLVEMHGGEIMAESELSVSTTFNIKLPVVMEVAQ